MVAVSWLLLAYLLHTTGELCLSPVGLSMVTKLSPARIVSTVMGAWFLATAFSNFLAGLIAQLTGPASSSTVGKLLGRCAGATSTSRCWMPSRWARATSRA